MKCTLLLRAALAALLLAPLAPAAEPDRWEALKSLAGEWDAKGPEGHSARVSYKVVSNGSAVMETLKVTGGPEMVTVYHRDGDALMLTHYCAAGNQPRMRAVSADGKRFEFRFLDVTNLKSREADHMRDLTLTIVDADHVTQEYTGREKGKDTKATFVLTRVK